MHPAGVQQRANLVQRADDPPVRLVPGADADQEVRPRSRNLRGQEPGPEVPVGQQTIPACRPRNRSGALVISLAETGPNTASMTVRVPQLTRASSRSVG